MEGINVTLAPDFDRWNARNDHTWVFRVFQQHHKQLNQFIWAYVPVNNDVSKKAKKALEADPGASTVDHFSFRGVDDRRLQTQLSDWQKDYKQFSNWVRLNALMAMSSYLETYMASAISLAVESDIRLLHGVPKHIDGARVLKYAQAVDYSHEAQKCVGGDWPKRLSEYKKLFGHVPPLIETEQGELERLRVLRNKIGHGFGRDIDKSRNEETWKLQIWSVYHWIDSKS